MMTDEEKKDEIYKPRILKIVKDTCGITYGYLIETYIRVYDTPNQYDLFIESIYELLADGKFVPFYFKVNGEIKNMILPEGTTFIQ